MDVEKIFSFSDNLIDKTDSNFECIYYYLPPKFSKDLGNSVLYSSMWTLDKYYENKKLPENVGYQHYIIVREMIKNSRWHGGSKNNSPTYFGLFIHPEKFIFGCNDGGDYFKKQDIKNIWENKKKLKEYHQVDNKDIGYHFGYMYFRDALDEIKVDTKEGTLYGIIDIKKYLERISSK